MNFRRNIKRTTTIKAILLVILSVLLATACSIPKFERDHVFVEKERADSKCRTVQHLMGEACIPITPQRIVTLDPTFILDPLIALGLKDSIVGTSCYDWGLKTEKCVAPGLSSTQLEGIEVVGSTQPSLEKIMLLKPDLILAFDYSEAIYDYLSKVAPTVILNFNDTKLSFKTHLHNIAKLVDREVIAEKILVQYQKRIAELKKQIDNHLDSISVSVVSFGWNQFSVSPTYAVWFEILKDIGINIQPVFSEEQESFFTNFSVENIGAYDADILFIANFDRKPASYFLEDPLISSLQAVKSGRTYIIDGRDVWDVYGPIGVTRLLNLLSEYLLNAVQTFNS